MKKYISITLILMTLLASVALAEVGDTRYEIELQERRPVNTIFSFHRPLGDANSEGLGRHVVTITRDCAFNPKSLRVKSGEGVSLLNTDRRRLVELTLPGNENMILRAKRNTMQLFKAPGTHTIHCLSGTRTGKLTVQVSPVGTAVAEQYGRTLPPSRRAAAPAPRTDYAMSASGRTLPPSRSMFGTPNVRFTAPQPQVNTQLAAARARVAQAEAALAAAQRRLDEARQRLAALQARR